MARSRTMIIRLMFAMLLLSAILNGTAFWLKRVGWYQPQLKHYYLHHFVVGWGHQWTDKERKELQTFTNNIYQSNGGEKLLKLAKYLWFACFIVVSAIILRRDGDQRYRKPPWPLLLIAILVLLGGAQSVFRFGPGMLVGGLRFFSFLAIAWLGYWAVRRESLNFLAQGLLLFMLFQLVLAPIEVRLGVHVFGTYYGARAAGTMLQPSSLGLMTVLSLIFYMQFSTQTRWLLIPAIAITGAIVLYSQSASALLLLLLVLAAKIYLRLPQRWRITALLSGGTAFILFIVLLPLIMQRYDVFDSLWGRFFKVETYIDSVPSLAGCIFGQGLGVGTNSSLNIALNWQHTHHAVNLSSILFVADSTPLSLLAQLGVVGIVAFYGLLGYAAWRDARAAPLYLGISVASMTSIIAELFPLNIMLGLLLARSLFLQQNAHRPTPL